MSNNSEDHIVDQVIGSAYQVVKYVAANMPTLIELAATLSTPADGTGDMTQEVYDTDGDGKVNEADTADTITGADAAGSDKYYGTDADGVAGFHNLPAGGGGVTVMPLKFTASGTFDNAGALNVSSDSSTYTMIKRMKLVDTYDPNGIIDTTNMYVVVPDGVTHFDVVIYVDMTFSGGTSEEVTVNPIVRKKDAPWSDTVAGAELSIIARVNPTWNYDYWEMQGHSTRKTCTPGQLIGFGMFWEGADGTYDDIESVSGTFTVNFYNDV